MKYYMREYIGIDNQGRFRKKVYTPTFEYVKTNNIEKYNKNKKYKFYESDIAKKYLLHKIKDYVYIEHEKLDSKQLYFRKKIS